MEKGRNPLRADKISFKSYEINGYSDYLQKSKYLNTFCEDIYHETTPAFFCHFPLSVFTHNSVGLFSVCTTLHLHLCLREIINLVAVAMQCNIQS